jgi:hypothetical protein
MQIPHNLMELLLLYHIYIMAKKGNKRRTKRALRPWIIFVQKIAKENPGKPFKDVLKMASTIK